MTILQFPTPTEPPKRAAIPLTFLAATLRSIASDIRRKDPNKCCALEVAQLAGVAEELDRQAESFPVTDRS